MTIKPTKQTIESTLRICKLAAALILIVIISSNANAIPLTFELSGTVSRVDETGLASLVGGSIKVGDTIAGTYTYDTSTPNSGTAPTFGTYTDTSANSGFNLTINGLTFHSDPNNVNFVVGLQNDLFTSIFVPDHTAPPTGGLPPGHTETRGPADAMTLSSYTNFSPFTSNGDFSFIGWQLDDPTGAALSTTDLPVTAPVLADWARNSLKIESKNQAAQAGVSIGSIITSVRLVTGISSVPESGSTYSLLGFALLGLAALRRKLS